MQSPSNHQSLMLLKHMGELVYQGGHKTVVSQSMNHRRSQWLSLVQYSSDTAEEQAGLKRPHIVIKGSPSHDQYGFSIQE